MSILTRNRFLNNTIERETVVRLQFFRAEKELLVSNAASAPSTAKKMKEELLELRTLHRNLQKELDNMVEEHRLRRESWRKEKVTDFTKYPTELQDPRAFKHPMYPVSEEMYNLLKLHKGTKIYLHERDKSVSRDKFYLPYTTTHIYGWEKPYRRTEAFGNVHALTEAMYRRRCVQRDPVWYPELATHSPNVCTTASLT